MLRPDPPLVGPEKMNLCPIQRMFRRQQLKKFRRAVAAADGTKESAPLVNRLMKTRGKYIEGKDGRTQLRNEKEDRPMTAAFP